MLSNRSIIPRVKHILHIVVKLKQWCLEVDRAAVGCSGWQWVAVGGTVLLQCVEHLHEITRNRSGVGSLKNNISFSAVECLDAQSEVK